MSPNRVFLPVALIARLLAPEMTGERRTEMVREHLERHTGRIVYDSRHKGTLRTHDRADELTRAFKRCLPNQPESSPIAHTAKARRRLRRAARKLLVNAKVQIRHWPTALGSPAR